MMGRKIWPVTVFVEFPEDHLLCAFNCCMSGSNKDPDRLQIHRIKASVARKCLLSTYLQLLWKPGQTSMGHM